jgi:hypothetical protein
LVVVADAVVVRVLTAAEVVTAPNPAVPVATTPVEVVEASALLLLQLPISTILVNVNTVSLGPKFTSVRSLRCAKLNGPPFRFVAKPERGMVRVCGVPFGVRYDERR